MKTKCSPDDANGRKEALAGLGEAVGRNSPLPTVAVHSDRHIVTYANSAFCDLFGKDRSEVVGLPFSEVAPDNNHCQVLLDRVYRTGDPETVDDREEESSNPVLWSYSIWPVETANGGASGIMVQIAETTGTHRQAVEMNESLIFANLRQHELREAAEDLSVRLQDEIRERKRGEAALRRSEESFRELSRSLEKRVEERTAELVEQAGRLRHLASELVSSEQRERKHLAAILHDDLQQLLVAASMHLNIAKKRIREDEDRQVVENAVKWIAEATHAARDLTAELRPPALYEKGFVAALPWLASQTWERHQIKVSITADEQSTPISDEFNAMLFDCVRELLLNAVKHAGVAEVTVCVREEKEVLRVSVHDKGKGFDVEKAQSGGSWSGFGLFSIRERLLALGGDISIASRSGEGTRIEIEVPLLIAESEQDEEPPYLPVHRMKPQKRAASRQDKGGQTARVLIVDDHAMVRQGLATMLCEYDRINVVGEACDGIEAIEAVEKYHPNVVLIDVNMPRMNGIEATREIRRLWPEINVIALSVQDDETTANLMREAGAKAFFSKGGNADHLAAAVLSL